MFFADNTNQAVRYELTLGKHTIRFVVNRREVRSRMFVSADVSVNGGDWSEYSAAFGHAANETGVIDASHFNFGIDGAAADLIRAEATSVLQRLFEESDDPREDDFLMGLQSENAAKYRDQFEVSIELL